MKTFMFNVRLTPTELSTMDGLVNPAGFSSRSHFVVEAIHQLMFSMGVRNRIGDMMRKERQQLRKRSIFTKESKTCRKRKKKKARRSNARSAKGKRSSSA